jgi:hypothetical protein
LFAWSPDHLYPSKDKAAALTVVISDFRGIQDPVWQRRNVAAGLPAGARRGLLAVEYFQSVLVACGNGVGETQGKLTPLLPSVLAGKHRQAPP